VTEELSLEPTAPRTVLITGSSSGIGAGIARAFAERGARVAINSSASVTAGTQLADELGGIYLQADVGDASQAQELPQRAAEALGGLDAVINCAGTTDFIPHQDLQAAGPEVWRRIFEVNVFGAWSVITGAIESLRESGRGQVINITSTSGTRPDGSSIPYAASKAALNHVTALLAKSLGPAVRVNAIAPGLVDTPWTADWPEAHERVRQVVALRRPGVPVDIGVACVLLAEASYITGAVLPVDGGLSLL
jgi:ketoreductase RED2